jgi:hypothetical protein
MTFGRIAFLKNANVKEGAFHYRVDIIIEPCNVNRKHRTITLKFNAFIRYLLNRSPCRDQLSLSLIRTCRGSNSLPLIAENFLEYLWPPSHHLRNSPHNLSLKSVLREKSAALALSHHETLL